MKHVANSQPLIDELQITFNQEAAAATSNPPIEAQQQQ